MLTPSEVYLLTRDVFRLRRLCLELVDLLRRDATLYKRLKSRSKRYIKKLEAEHQKYKEANDKLISRARFREEALKKLTKREQEVLGLIDIDWE